MPRSESKTKPAVKQPSYLIISVITAAQDRELSCLACCAATSVKESTYEIVRKKMLLFDRCPQVPPTSAAGA